MTDNLSKSLFTSQHELSWANRGLKGNSAADVKDLCDAIERSKIVKALRLEGNTINEEAAKAIGKSLAKHPEIERLVWNDLFTTRLKTEVPPSLIQLTRGLLTNGARIVELNLSDNAFGPIGVKGLEKFLSSSACFTLEELRLNNCGMGSAGGKLLADALISCHKNSQISGVRPFALKQFIAGRNRLENEGAEALAKAFRIIGSLEVIRMPQNGIRPPGIEALTESLVENKNLRILDLNDNTITKAAEKLASAISKLTRLEILNLESSLIRTRGAKAVARAIVSHKNLQEIYLGCNEIRLEAGLDLARAVRNLGSLKIFDLNGNCFGFDGIDEIRHLLENRSFLEKMRFSDDEGTETENESSTDEESNEIQTIETKTETFGNISNFISKVDLQTTKPTIIDEKTNNSKTNRWKLFENAQFVKEHLKINVNDEKFVDRFVEILEDLCKDSSLPTKQSSLIGQNLFQSVKWTGTLERQFNERFLVVLGFVKDEQTGRQRCPLYVEQRIAQILFDLHSSLPKSTRNLLSIFLRTRSFDNDRSLSEIREKFFQIFLH